MNRRVAVVWLVFVLVLVVGVLGFAKQDQFEGEGLRISPRYDSEIYADQLCWVRHGWGGLPPGGQPEIKANYGDQKFVIAGRMTFRLYIDGKEVKLSYRRDVFPGDEPGTNISYWTYYIQFEPYHFEPGVYELMGVWDIKNPNQRALFNMVNPNFTVPFTFVSTLTVLERQAQSI